MSPRIKDFIHVYGREFRIVAADPGLIIFFIFLPLVYPVIYSLIYNPELVRDVAVVVVDNDRTPQSRQLVREMDATEGCRVIGYATDLPEARRAMNEHRCYGILEIPQGFQRNIGRGEQAPAVLYCEMSLLLRYRALLVSSTDVMTHMGAQIQTRKIEEMAPLAQTLVPTGDPLPVSSVSMGVIKDGFCSFIMPGILVLIMHQCVMLAVGMAGGAKREDPRLIGYNAANHCRSTLLTMIAQMLVYCTIMVIPVMYMIHIVPWMFAFPMAGNEWEEMAFLLPMVLGAICLAYILQGVMTEREDIFILWVITSVFFLFLSGLTWPRYAMPPFWKGLSDICLSTWGVEGFVKMNTNGATLGQVATEWRNLWILDGVYFVMAYCVQRWVVIPREGRVKSLDFRL